MLFNSLEFIYIFLPLAVLLHFLAARWSVTAAVMATTLSSLVFYAWWKPPFVILPVISIAGNYWLAQEILRADARTGRRIMQAGVTANLLVLGYFKYFDFLVSIVERRSPMVPDVPLALSFTTFVQVAFLVELARDRTPVVFPRYAMFVSFFPHLIAGPIVRWTELGPQLADKLRYQVDWNNVALGLTVFCMGPGKENHLRGHSRAACRRRFDAAAACVSTTRRQRESHHDSVGSVCVRAIQCIRGCKNGSSQAERQEQLWLCSGQAYRWPDHVLCIRITTLRRALRRGLWWIPVEWKKRLRGGRRLGVALHADGNPHTAPQPSTFR